jgi:hypothetical protein
MTDMSWLGPSSKHHPLPVSDPANFPPPQILCRMCNGTMLARQSSIRLSKDVSINIRNLSENCEEWPVTADPRHRAQYVIAAKSARCCRDRLSDTTALAIRPGHPMRASKQMNLCSRLRSKRRQASPAKRNQVEDDAEVSRGRPRTTAVAHAIKINRRERLAADCDRSSCRRIWLGCQFAGCRDEEA